MESSIPDGISLSALQDLAAEAAITENCGCGNRGVRYGKQELTKDELIELSDAMLKVAMEECTDPMIHKVMALDILARLTEWHRIISQEQGFDEAWMLDAGKLQAAMQLLQSVEIGSDDFTCHSDIELTDRD